MSYTVVYFEAEEDGERFILKENGIDLHQTARKKKV